MTRLLSATTKSTPRVVSSILRDGRSFDAQGAQVSPDSTFWNDPGSRQGIAVSTQDVHRITFKSRAKGAKRGLIIGALIGLPSGALVNDPKSGDEVTVGERIGASLAGGLFGTLWGAGIGALVGRQVTYFIHPAELARGK